LNPIAYLLISLEITSVMLAIIFLIAWHNFGRHRYALIWSATFAVAAVQWVLNLGSKTFFSDYNVYWMIVSATSIITVSLALAGHRLRAGRRNPILVFIVAGVFVEAAIGFFTFVQPHNGLRTAIGPFYGATMIGLCAPAVLRFRARPLPSEWGAALVLGAFALCEAIAGIAILSGGAAGNPDATQLYLAVNFLSLPAAYIGSGLFTILILASDMSEATKRLAIIDPLTELLNRRGFNEAAERSFAATRRSGSPLSAVLADIDHFKSINDLHGHAGGDRALRAFAQCVREHARASDIAGRIGGEEFVLLLPDTTMREGAEIAERLRTATRALSIAGEPGTFGIRASFGVATLEAEDVDIESLLRRGDAALYQSKELGRDRVTATSRGVDRLAETDAVLTHSG